MFKRILIAAMLLSLVPATLFAAPPLPDRSYIGQPMNGTWTIMYRTETLDEWIYSYTAHGNILRFWHSAGEFRVSKHNMNVRFIDTGRGITAYGTMNLDNSIVVWIPVPLAIWPPHWEYLR